MNVNSFFKIGKKVYLRDAVKNHHQELIETLSNKDRKRVLRIIYNYILEEFVV